jgi:hypothetical protein
MAEATVPSTSGRFYDFFKPDGLRGAEAGEAGALADAQGRDEFRVSGISSQIWTLMKAAKPTRALKTPT